MSETAILEVDNVWRRYASSPTVSQGRAGRILMDSLFGFGRDGPKRRDGEVDILKGVSFSLKRGEALGVIGFNGAGKTTLLRMLAGHVLPDQGQVRVRGETGALIDLTAGLKDSMSGLANIFLRSAILGRRRRDVEANVDDIVAFTELGSAIHNPISTYSAGMRMRLAFATTVFMNPDLLLIDEVLSVGDFKFRQKCLERIRALRARSAFVLVSHSMNDISRFCDTVVVLDQGRVTFSGAPDDAIAFYQRAAEKKATPAIQQKARRPLGDFIHKSHAIADVSTEWQDGNGQAVESLPTGGRAVLRLRFTPLRRMRNLIVGVPIFSSSDEMLTALSSDQMSTVLDHEPGVPVEVEIEIGSLPLTPGDYRAVIAIVDGPEYLYRQPVDDLIVNRGPLPKYWGEFVMPQQWTTRS